LADKKHGGGKSKPKHEHNVVISGAISAHTPVEEQKERGTERQEDATKHDTERTEDRGRESIKIFIEGFTLLAVLFYSAVTTWQGCLLRQSIRNNTDQFHIDQRPYVWTSNKRPKTNIHAGSRLWVNVEAINYGKSPALKVSVMSKVFMGKDAENIANLWFDSMGDKAFPTKSDNEIVIPPGIPSLLPQPSDLASGKGSIPHIPIGEEAERIANSTPDGGFGGGGFFTILSDNVLQQSDVDYVLNTEQAFVLAIRVQYSDAFGNRYWSDICSSHFANGTMPNCTYHNQMH
jgi:hypothetical protein